jgi:hypothetical protein
MTDSLEVQRRYKHVQDLHERASEAVRDTAIPIGEAMARAREYFQAAAELEREEREHRDRIWAELARVLDHEVESDDA